MGVSKYLPFHDRQAVFEEGHQVEISEEIRRFLFQRVNNREDLNHSRSMTVSFHPLTKMMILLISMPCPSRIFGTLVKYVAPALSSNSLLKETFGEKVLGKSTPKTCISFSKFIMTEAARSDSDKPTYSGSVLDNTMSV